MNEDIKAACAEMKIEDAEKLFFSNVPAKQVKAIAMCNSCTMKTQCLQFALDNSIEYGIFGGMTSEDRMVMISEINSCFTSAGTP